MSVYALRDKHRPISVIWDRVEEHCTFSEMGKWPGARWRLPGRLKPAAPGCPQPAGYPGCPPPNLPMQPRQCGASPSRQAALGGKCANGFSSWHAPQSLPSPDCSNK